MVRKINVIYLRERYIPLNCLECPFTTDYFDFPNLYCSATGELINDCEVDEERHCTCPIRKYES